VGRWLVKRCGGEGLAILVAGDIILQCDSRVRLYTPHHASTSRYHTRRQALWTLASNQSVAKDLEPFADRDRRNPKNWVVKDEKKM
jgi:hypothetical protein